MSSASECALARDHEAETRHALDALVRRRHERFADDLPHVERHRAECAHRIDQQLAAFLRDDGCDFVERIQNAGTRLAMDRHYMRDARVGIEHARHFDAARRQIVALVEQRARAAEIFERRGRALAVRTVREHERVAVARNQATEHRFDAVAAAALQRHAVVVARGVSCDLQQARAQLRGHRAEVAVPRAPVAQHRLLRR